MNAILMHDVPSSEVVGRSSAQLPLAEVSQFWTLATPPERNVIGLELLADVVIDNRMAVASLPRLELAPFFLSLECQRV